MKENKKVKLLVLLLILTVMAIMPTGSVKASLQANQNTQYTKADTATNWIKAVREMEAAGEAMGLSETLNEDLTASSNSNGIDVHMVRTTEYGAMAILSASGYGNPSNDNKITTSTGNKTGIILNTNYWEWTAGGGEYFLTNVNNKYIDKYTKSQNSAKVGDGLGTSTTTNLGTAGWHQSSTLWFENAFYGFWRGYGSIFSFYSNYSSGSSNYARATAICGEGL